MLVGFDFPECWHPSEPDPVFDKSRRARDHYTVVLQEKRARKHADTSSGRYRSVCVHPSHDEWRDRCRRGCRLLPDWVLVVIKQVGELGESLVPSKSFI